MPSMPILSLDDARILHSSGLGVQVNPRICFRAELSDDATFSIYKPGMFGELLLCSTPLNILTLRVGTEVVQSGGGFIGGGFGVVGAVEGMLGAAVLNALTTRLRTH